MKPAKQDFPHMERVMARAWPSFMAEDYDGWDLRFADGYTKRANSVNPHFGSTLPLMEKIARCEAAYKQRGLATIFRLTPFSQPSRLDETLAQRGYKTRDPSLVMAAAVTEGQLFDSRPVAHVTADTWFSAFNQLRGLERGKQSAHRSIVEGSKGKHCYALLMNGAVPRACGLGVLVEDTVCLFDLFTSHNYRRQGHGAGIVASILHWAREHGAQMALLQVERENAVARRLYERFGFVEAYGYWYRVKM